ncbi:MAG: T9SS type A sorting domain-containing protein [Chitinophagaceae bacterium]
MTKFLLIISFILSTTISAQAQNAPLPDAAATIVRFFPNPATTVINFDLQRNQNNGLGIQIFNFLGKKMYESNNMNQRTSINLTDFNRGVYIYQIRDRNGKMIESGKFQVSK